MDSAVAQESARQDAIGLLRNVGVSRVVVVDDVYAARVSDVLGICDELGGTATAGLPHLDAVDPNDPDEERSDFIRDIWNGLSNSQRRRLLAEALRVSSTTNAEEVEAADGPTTGDAKAAGSLEDVLEDLEGVEFVPLSLSEWKENRGEYVAGEAALETLLLFDRDFSGEGGGENEGLRQIQQVQSDDVGFCGLLTHTVSLGEEYAHWQKLADEEGLNPDKFVVIAKERLRQEPPNYHRFLGMLRLTALSGRYAEVRNKAWSIFESSVDKAKSAMEGLSVLDFDRMVFASSREQSVWEPDTLLRVFGILMRRAASAGLHEDDDFLEVVAGARRVSDAAETIVGALKRDDGSNEALEMQRFECYDSGEELNRFFVPIDLGDIFRIGPAGKLYMLLAQPCDLVVRKTGRRNYETDRLRRMGAVAELVLDAKVKKESWGHLPFFEEVTGKSAFVNFGKVHQVPMTVLDLCAVNSGGSAAIDVEAAVPELLIEPWRVRYEKLCKLYREALGAHAKLTGKRFQRAITSLALPGSSSTLNVSPIVNGKSVRYEVERRLRLRQPRSGALLTEFAQYQARAAFEHDFGAP